MYDETVADLGRPVLSFDIEDGALLAVRYVCTEDICHCYLKVDDDWYQIDSLQPGMAEPKNRFLLSMLSFTGLPKAEGTRRYELTGTAPEGAEVRQLRQIGTRKTCPSAEAASNLRNPSYRADIECEIERCRA